MLKPGAQAAMCQAGRWRFSNGKEGVGMENLCLLLAIIDLFWWLRK